MPFGKLRVRLVILIAKRQKYLAAAFNLMCQAGF
jgi:hypothetical protein